MQHPTRLTEEIHAPRLGKEFYARPALWVARDCIGKLLLHRMPEGVTVGRIVEAEAYCGPQDRAAHSHGGRRTRRTEAMFGPPGHAYVFVLYGQHWHFNLVTDAEDVPRAVLIRAVEPLLGMDLMAQRRNVAATRRELCNGPGKLAQAFGINATQYGWDLCSSDLALLDAPRTRWARSPRIGVGYAGAWASRRFRFYEPGNTYVSSPPRV